MNSKRIGTFLLATAMAVAMAACSQAETEKTAENKPVEIPAVTTPTAPATSATPATPAPSTPAEPIKEDNGIPKVSLLTPEEIEAMKKEPMFEQGVTLTYTGGNYSSAPFVAEKLGMYEQYGIKSETVVASSFIEGIGTNSIQFGVGHIATLLVPITNGVNFSIIEGTHVGCLGLFVLADSEYETVEDLKGKNIGVPGGIGAWSHNTALRMFDKAGMDALKDFNATPIELDTCLIAMENGEIAGFIGSDIWAYDLVKEGKLRVVRSLLDEDMAQDPCCVVVMSNQFIEENPLMAKAITECMKLGEQWMRENPEEAVQMLLDENKLSGDFDKNVELWKTLNFGPNDEFTEKALRQFADDYIRFGLITSVDTVDEVMEMAWNPVAKDSGLGYDVNEVDGTWWN